MARETHDREDLLLEGVNLPKRARLRHIPSGREWVVGWRTGRGPAIYDGPDRVFQFNGDNQLRRVYLEGIQLAAQGGRLCQLNRFAPNPSGEGVEKVKLVWQPIDRSFLEKVLAEWAFTRQPFSAAIHALLTTSTAESPPTPEYSWVAVGETEKVLLERSQSWMKSITDRPAIASQANA